MISFKKGKGGVVNYDIVVSTEKGAVCACKFVWEAELASVGIDAGTWANVNTAHCLLGHKNEDSTRKTSKELGWVFMHGTLKAFEHCMKLKAIQKKF